MTMANTTCESFYHSPSSGPRSRRHGCTECIEPGMAEYQAGSNSEYFSPGPSLASATDYDNTSDLCNGKDAVFDNRRAMCFPGAWAIGEGVLLEVLEEDGVGSPTASEDSADSSADSIRRRTLSCLAGNLTATMGTYLTNLASAITGCTGDAAVLTSGSNDPDGGAGRNVGNRSNSSNSSGSSSSSSSTRRWTSPSRRDAGGDVITQNSNKGTKKEN
ncbi:hypothetical protein Vretimale_405 [Volvox reticuliferus]|uniref:Uncharacterized protein n=1 Tax=Volvox reticuliferus TaxID=1737510 RepID=A0A8J4D7E3_9CHLO|nr:hypothetical protein Vretimale_405 [Volvox reticuliferus]